MPVDKYAHLRARAVDWLMFVPGSVLCWAAVVFVLERIYEPVLSLVFVLWIGLRVQYFLLLLVAPDQILYRRFREMRMRYDFGVFHFDRLVVHFEDIITLDFGAGWKRGRSGLLIG